MGVVRAVRTPARLDAAILRATLLEQQVSLAGVIQLVECQLPKLDVAGSSPVARSEITAVQ